MFRGKQGGKKDIKKLVRNFSLEGYYKVVDNKRHISTKISPAELEEALRRSNLSYRIYNGLGRMGMMAKMISVQIRRAEVLRCK